MDKHTKALFQMPYETRMKILYKLKDKAINLVHDSFLGDETEIVVDAIRLAKQLNLVEELEKAIDSALGPEFDGLEDERFQDCATRFCEEKYYGKPGHLCQKCEKGE